MENNAFHYNSLARTLMGYRKLPWNPGWLLPEEPNRINYLENSFRFLVVLLGGILQGSQSDPNILELNTSFQRPRLYFAA